MKNKKDGQYIGKIYKSLTREDNDDNILCS